MSFLPPSLFGAWLAAQKVCRVLLMGSCRTLRLRPPSSKTIRTWAATYGQRQLSAKKAAAYVLFLGVQKADPACCGENIVCVRMNANWQLQTESLAGLPISFCNSVCDLLIRSFTSLAPRRVGDVQARSQQTAHGPCIADELAPHTIQNPSTLQCVHYLWPPNPLQLEVGNVKGTALAVATVEGLMPSTPPEGPHPGHRTTAEGKIGKVPVDGKAVELLNC